MLCRIDSIIVLECCEAAKNHVRRLVSEKPTLTCIKNLPLLLKTIVAFHMFWEQLIGVTFSSLFLLGIRLHIIVGRDSRGVVDAPCDF